MAQSLICFVSFIYVMLSNFLCLISGPLPQYGEKDLPDRSQIFYLLESDRSTYILSDPDFLERYYSTLIRVSLFTFIVVVFILLIKSV